MPVGVSRAVIEVLLDRVHQGAVILSPEARVTYANQRLATMLGRTRAHLVGKPLAELVVEADRQTLADALAAGRDTASQCRVVMPRPNGNGGLQALLIFAPLGHGQASCLVTDLSPGRNGVLAHEVRNILGGIRNSVEVLKHAPLVDDAQRAVESIERQSGRILDLLNSKEQARSS
ncbi:MAG TPA: PAS domain-containing protein [Burkholderiales bacterium]|nr:PAS domain-containing protein [Burkholderiales bacterium]